MYLLSHCHTCHRTVSGPHVLLPWYQIPSLHRVYSLFIMFPAITPHSHLNLPVEASAHAPLEFSQESEVKGFRHQVSSVSPLPRYLQSLWALEVSLSWKSVGNFTTIDAEDLLDAILIARRTLCQFPNTVATARRSQYRPPLNSLRDSVPSVPSESVDNFSSSICICPAKPALRSRNCFRFSSSAFFSFIRARRMGD